MVLKLEPVKIYLKKFLCVFLALSTCWLKYHIWYLPLLNFFKIVSVTISTKFAFFALARSNASRHLPRTKIHHKQKFDINLNRL